MTQTQGPAIRPFMPPSRSPRGSILDIASTGPFGYLSLDGAVESFNCIGVDVDAVDCDGFLGLTKRWDPPSFSDAVMFNIQSGVVCKGFGFDMNDPRLRTAFEVMEAEGVSIGLHDLILINGTDLTGGTAVTPAQALGLLEGAGHAQYAGQPVIHAGPMLASLWAASTAVVPVGNHLETHLGTPVAVSAGNETKTGGVLDHDQWAFVTGAVVLGRSDAVLASELDRSTNDIRVLYERLYTAAVDCLVAKVKVTVI